MAACHSPRAGVAESASNSPMTWPTYLQARHHLMQRDSQLYASANVELNESEHQLNRHLKELQGEMIDHYRATHFFPPARNFYQSKQHIEQTPLFEILRSMPKGGILHLHMSAMGDANWIIDRAIATPEMHVYWGRDSRRTPKGTLRAYATNQAPPDYFSVEQLAKELPQFRDSLHSLLTFDASIDQDSVDIWGEFEKIFVRINGFTTYAPIWTDYLTHGLEILVQDQIQHAELRLPFWNDLYTLEESANRTALAPFVETFVQAKERMRQLDSAFTLNIIHANLRFFDEQTIWRDIQFTHANRARYPEWVKGYDLVAEEDAGYPTIVHAPSFLRLDSLEGSTGVPLPLFLHDGESDWASVDNLYDAVLLGSQRIGHGFNLFRFPHLMDLVREQKIAMEINPLSNQILGYLRDLRIHPASSYLRQGIQLTISSDDPLIFDYHGLSYDFWSIFLAWELDLADLKHLCANSIDYSAMADSEKNRAKKIWEQRWHKWVKQEVARWASDDR